MRNLLLLLLFFCLTPFTTKAQKLEFNGEFLLFREAKTKQPVLIINDSLVYKGNAMKRIAFKHTDYLDKLQEYVYFNIGTKTYLVHKGCGPVLEFRNDSIVKINDNYLQRNQYGAVHFVYNNEIYFFGGYGLFTTKNILTKYNFKTKDWVEIQTYGEKAQDPRSGANSYIKGENLYVFGGGAKDINEITATKLLDNKVWRLHLPTMKWKCIGVYNEEPMKFDIINVFNDSKNIYLQSGQYFLEIDYFTSVHLK
jgi:N-acetylneuraminic acid mutarotase